MILRSTADYRGLRHYKVLLPLQHSGALRVLTAFFKRICLRLCEDVTAATQVYQIEVD